MRVITLKPGYFGRLRAVDDEFDVPDGDKASWFAPVAATTADAEAEAAPKRGRKAAAAKAADEADAEAVPTSDTV